ncbi:MAG: leucine-rich repeat domain-containing protein [Ruminococcaceae bacterium]|nr:leucine-rich repeat domain-containing protein [Oscillospiraceae bacterium]
MESHSVNSKHFTKKLPFFIVGLAIIAIGIFLFAGHLIVVVNEGFVLSNARSYENHRLDATDKDLENLKYLTKLEHLWLHYTPQITDISFVSEMKDLKSFSVGSQNIVNLDLLKNCKKLETLYLFDTNLTNLDILTGNTELRALDIKWGNPVRDISGLRKLGKLELLSILSSEITDISPIGSLGSLTFLDLSCGSISDISVLADCKSLKRLSLIDCKQVTDISPLAELKYLEEILICNTAINDFTPLLSMESLKKVVASDGQIDSSILAKLEAKNITVELL